MTAQPPLVLDIDGTLTRPDAWGIDPRVFDPLRAWEAPIVLATGKAFPYPIALCHFVGIPELVVGENGGVVYTGEDVIIAGDREGAEAVAREYEAEGYSLGWDGADTVNRWRETELAVRRGRPLEPLERIAAERGLEVVDTGYAYHVKDPTISKGRALEILADEIDLGLSECVAIGDSANDVSTFERVGNSFAVANADEDARRAADEVLDRPHADGALAVLDRFGGGSKRSPR